MSIEPTKIMIAGARNLGFNTDMRGVLSRRLLAIWRRARALANALTLDAETRRKVG
jgi:hypothetical protein